MATRHKFVRMETSLGCVIRQSFPFVVPVDRYLACHRSVLLVAVVTTARCFLILFCHRKGRWSSFSLACRDLYRFAVVSRFAGWL